MRKLFFLLLGLVLLFYSCDLAKKVIEDKLPQEKNETEDIISEITGEKKAEIIIDSNITKLSKKEIKRLKKERERQDKIAAGDTLGLVKKTWQRYFPKREDRIAAYPKMYEENIKSILILYPWNRSKTKTSPEMYMINMAKELSQKGYYVISPLLIFDKYEKDTMFSVQFIKHSDSKKYKTEYGVDAVMFVTIYSLHKPWWSSNISSIAEYNLISTSTCDTLFSRKAEFSYDSPIPPYKADKSKETYEFEQKILPLFGACFQMQRSVFMDFPFGPYHKKHLKDRKKFAYPPQMNYKMDARPS